MKNHWNSAYMKKWIISVALPVLILLIPTTESFTPVLRMYLAITLWSIMAFAFELLNNMATSLLLLFGYGLTGVCSLSVPLSVFSTESVWITLCALALVTLIQKTHILERLAYTLSDKVGGSYVGIVYAVAVFSLLARLLLQGALAGVAALAVAYGISSALGYGKSKASAGILLTSAFVYLDSNYFLYSPDYIAVAWDRKAPTFRHEEYKEYKAGRRKMRFILSRWYCLWRQLRGYANRKKRWERSASLKKN